MLARTALARLRAKVPSAAARDVALLSRQLRTALATTITTTNNATATAPLSIAQFQRIRGYATATATKTRASTAAKKAPAKKATATKKTAAPAKKATATKKAAAKPKKAAAKPKKKGVTPIQAERLEKRKLRAAEQKEKDYIKQLKQTALQEPKQKPSRAFQILLIETLEKEGNPKGITEVARSASQKYKNLSPSEMERLNRLAKEADEENKKAYKKWVESHTPVEIRRANNARRLLKTKLASFPKSQIHDDRAVSQPKTAYIHFFQERHASGELKNISTVEAAKLVGKEWNALSASDKKKYEDKSAEERESYHRKFKSVYGYATHNHPKATDTA